MTETTGVCVLCSLRDPEALPTPLEQGHCCDKCRLRLGRDLRDIVRLCDRAAEHVQPGRGTGNSRPGFESRPPIALDAVDPEMAYVAVDAGNGGPLLEVLESWERLIRAERAFAAYGIASDLRQGLRRPVMPSDADPDGRTAVDRWFQTNDVERGNRLRIPSQGQATLTGVVSFLQAQIDWACTEPTFPLVEFASEVHSAWQTVRHWDHSQPAGTLVFCPTVIDDTGKKCGTKLRVTILTEIEGRDDHRTSVWCKGCGAVRRPDQLLAATGADDAYLPAAVISEYTGVAIRTIQEWGQTGKVKREGRTYRFGDVKDLVIAKMTRRGRSA